MHKTESVLKNEAHKILWDLPKPEMLQKQSEAFHTFLWHFFQI